MIQSMKERLAAERRTFRSHFSSSSWLCGRSMAANKKKKTSVQFYSSHQTPPSIANKADCLLPCDPQKELATIKPKWVDQLAFALLSPWQRRLVWIEGRPATSRDRHRARGCTGHGGQAESDRTIRVDRLLLETFELLRSRGRSDQRSSASVCVCVRGEERSDGGMTY